MKWALLIFIWPYVDEETGLTTTDQTKALLKAGILPPDPEKKISKKNNPKMTFDKMCREKWIFIARSHGLEIEDTPKPRDEAGKTLEEFQKEKDLFRNQVYDFVCDLTEKNIEALEAIPFIVPYSLTQAFKTSGNGPKSDARMPRESTGMNSWIR